MFVVIDEELVAVIVAGIAETLDRLVFEQLFLIAEAAVFKLEGPDVLGKIAGGNARRSSFEHEHFHALFGQLLGHPATACAGSHYDHVIDFARHGPGKL